MRQVFQSIGIFFAVISILGANFLPFPGLFAKVIEETGWLAVIVGIVLGSLAIIMVHKRPGKSERTALNDKKGYLLLDFLLLLVLGSWLIATVFTLGEAINNYFMLEWPAMLPAGIIALVIVITFLQGIDCLKQVLAIFAPYLIFFMVIVFLFSMTRDSGSAGQLRLASFGSILKDSLGIALLFGQMIMVRIALPLWNQQKKLLPISLGGVTVAVCLLTILLLGKINQDDAFQVFSYFGKLNYATCVGFSRYLWDSGALTFILWILCLILKLSIIFYCIINICRRFLLKQVDERNVTLAIGTMFLICIALVGLQSGMLDYINKIGYNGNYFGWLLLLIGYI